MRFTTPAMTGALRAAANTRMTTQVSISTSSGF